MMEVPFLDVRAGNLECGPQIEEATIRVLHSGHYILGSEVLEFERQFSEYVGARHCIGVANGHDALYLSLKAMDVGPGDEVIVPSLTFSATWLAVTLAGATPIAVDVDVSTGTIDPELILESLTANTKVIIPVHLYGCPADLESIRQIADENGLIVLEDAAQAHGAEYKGVRIGGHGNTSAWSFYPAKNLGAIGDGGAVTTDDDRLADRLRILRNYGSGIQYRHSELGINSRLDELQAAVLAVKLLQLDKWNVRRTELATRYLNSLSDERVILPASPSWARPSWHLFVVRVDGRDMMRDRLREAGIMTHVHYPIPVHRQEAFSNELSAARHLSVTDEMAATVLSLPIGPHLSDAQADRVIEEFGKAVAG
jgi:dTDP-4-amino-4,6-dideoxygalactose transaminase